jgi:beta-N-acetylhexosaminidase
MVDIAGHALTEPERMRLQHPLVGGVILFARNFASVDQLTRLCREIHEVRQPRLIIAVDHEGGRVQRFRDGFTRLPPMAELGRVWNSDPGLAQALAEDTGLVLAAELRTCGVDLSFTPVLDLDYGQCAVIGNRAFHRDPQVVAALAQSLQRGLKQGGMITVGKHFPGHGFVEGDSHHVIPADDRDYATLEQDDLVPFRLLAEAGMAGVMPAHVVYPAVDPLPAGYSPFWLQTVLRQRLGFQGVIFSDDLCMEGAAGAGDIHDRALAALHAGCDMVLVCNRPDLADRLLAVLQWDISAVSLARLAHLHGKGRHHDRAHLAHDLHYQQALQRVTALTAQANGLDFGPKVGE